MPAFFLFFFSCRLHGATTSEMHLLWVLGWDNAVCTVDVIIGSGAELCFFPYSDLLRKVHNWAETCESEAMQNTSVLFSYWYCQSSRCLCKWYRNVVLPCLSTSWFRGFLFVPESRDASFWPHCVTKDAWCPRIMAKWSCCIMLLQSKIKLLGSSSKPDF